MKTESKHTPGPWSQMNSAKAGFQDIVSWGNDEPQNRKFICEVGPSDTTFADAALISAAPTLAADLADVQAEIVRLQRVNAELLEALESILFVARGGADENNRCAVVRLTQQAIAKVEGR